MELRNLATCTQNISCQNLNMLDSSTCEKFLIGDVVTGREKFIYLLEQFILERGGTPLFIFHRSELEIFSRVFRNHGKLLCIGKFYIYKILFMLWKVIHYEQ